MSIELRVCKFCKEEKNIEDFHFKSKAKGIRKHQCKSCCKLYRHEYYIKNKEKIYEQTESYRKANPQIYNENTARWRVENCESIKNYTKTYNERNKEILKIKDKKRKSTPEHKKWYKKWKSSYFSIPENRERRKLKHGIWSKRNKDKICYYSSKRRSDLKNATPTWADLDIIFSFYQEAQYHGLQVDHIIPISHPLVCGLHCEFNLQLLTKTQNISKNNSFEVSEHEWSPMSLEEIYYE